MRYLLIDTQHENFSGKGSGVLLSEESALAKFKEIFDEGAQSGYYNNSTELMGRDVKSSDSDWEEFKKAL